MGLTFDDLLLAASAVLAVDASDSGYHLAGGRSGGLALWLRLA